MVPLKIIVFDLYDTLLYRSKKSSPYIDILRSSHKDKKAATWEHILTRYFSNTEHLFNNLERKGLIFEGIDQIRFQEKLEAELQEIRIYPDVLDSLIELKKQGYKLGVISNLATPYIAPFINFGMDTLIDYIVFSCEIGFSKPSPEIYNQLLKKAIRDFKQISFKEMLMIGNNYVQDVQIPREMGMQALFLDRLGLNKKGVTIRSLHELFVYI